MFKYILKEKYRCKRIGLTTYSSSLADRMNLIRDNGIHRIRHKSIKIRMPITLSPGESVTVLCALIKAWNSIANRHVPRLLLRYFVQQQKRAIGL